MARKTLDEAIREQQNWINEHGANEAGYVARYGSVHDAEHYGDGGEAIYAADKAALDRLVEERSTGRVHLTRRALGLT